MFGTPNNPASVYADLSNESAVRSADPYRLILLLFEGTETALDIAKLHLSQGNVSGKGTSISKAIDIIANGLKASLDVEHGGDLAERLAALYDYMVSRLLWGNMKNDPAAIDEVKQLLNELHEAWKMIDPQR